MRVERILLDLNAEWLHLLVHRACGVAGSSYGCSLLGSADVLDNCNFLLHVFHSFGMLCSILGQDALLAYARTLDEMAQGLERNALVLSSQHDVTQPLRWF